MIGSVRSDAGPIAGASVLIAPLPGQGVGTFTTTGVDGTFVANPPAGSYTVTVSPGAPYANEDLDVVAPVGADLVVLAAGQTVSGLDVVVGAPGSISGVVTAGGQPVSGVVVRASRAAGSLALPNSPLLQATTGADGSYRLDNVPVMEHVVSFQPPAATLALQWYDGQPSRSTARRVAIAHGQTSAGVNAALTAPGSISGTIVDAAGQPVVGAYVQATIDGDDNRIAVSGAGGVFDLPGLGASSAWQLFVTPPPELNALNTRTTLAVRSAEVTRATIRLETGARLAGTLLAVDGTPFTSSMYQVVACEAPGVPLIRGRMNPGCSDGRQPASSRLAVGTPPSAFVLDRLPGATLNVVADAGVMVGMSTMTATLPAGGRATCTFRLGATGTCPTGDTTPPTITCPAIPDVVLNTAGATATAQVDDEGAKSTVSSPLASTSVGTRSVRFQAADAAGNTATADCGYRVVYRFEGFRKPANADRQVNLAVGEQLRLEWKLRDAAGVQAKDPASFVSFSVVPHACATGVVRTYIDESARFRAGYALLDTGTHRFVWNAVAIAPRCATATIKLADGTTQSIEIRVTAA